MVAQLEQWYRNHGYDAAADSLTEPFSEIHKAWRKKPKTLLTILGWSDTYENVFYDPDRPKVETPRH